MASQNSQPEPDNAVCFSAILAEELGEIAKLRAVRTPNKNPMSPAGGEANHASFAGSSSDPNVDIAKLVSGAETNADLIFKRAREMSLVGLAFSGGGIRSATFNLGVLQGLAEQRLLLMFDYISTVSGGGYIGSWLTAWILRVGLAAKASEKEGKCESANSAVARVQEALIPDRSIKPEHAEPRPIRFLREYSNYLTPRVGLLGADTWTAIAIYLRNVLLNQSILILFLSSLLLLPHVVIQTTQRAIESGFLTEDSWITPCIAISLMLLALTIVAVNMKNLTGRQRSSVPTFGWYARQGWIIALVVIPLFTAAWIASAWLWSHSAVEWDSFHWALVGVLAFGLIWTLASLANLPSKGSGAPHWSSTHAWVWSIVFSFISGGVGGLLLGFVTQHLILSSDYLGNGIWHVVTLGAPAVIVVFLLVGTLQIGLIGLYFPDPRREWWARLGAYLLIVSVTWIAAFATSIYAPLGLMWLTGRMRTGAGLLWLASTLAGILGGKSSSTSATNSRSWIDAALSVTPYVFILGAASMIALLIEVGIAVINNHGDALRTFLEGSRILQTSGGWAISFDYLRGRGTIIPNVPVNAPPAYVQAHWEILNPTWNWHLLSLLAAFVGLCLFLSCRVNLNEFSMNLFYRNRLVRAYLGASDTTRKPSPFTGFDPDDDLHLKSFRADNCYSGPLPLVNCALNLVSGKDLAWQERKAESFVLTPLRCGFDTWLEQMDLKEEYSPVRRSAAVQKYGFRPTAKFGFSDLGLRLGTAISVSGAAASPNMGYHSSPSLGFLMTLFNVRLGFWAGNPRHDKTWMRPGPRVGLLYLLAELFGQTDDEASYVYLSDGGHFENLGLYELVKRRCKYIIASDADSDGSYAFGDIGNAIRKIRQDIGVEIELTIDPVFPAAPIATSGLSRPNGAGYGGDKNEFSKWHWGIGKIRYSLVDPNAEDGILVYLKTSITGDEPSDVINYRRQHSAFPHESTADQWFTESQFESYRRLGQHVIESLFEPRVPPDHQNYVSTPEICDVGAIFHSLKNKWASDLISGNVAVENTGRKNTL